MPIGVRTLNLNDISSRITPRAPSPGLKKLGPSEGLTVRYEFHRRGLVRVGTLRERLVLAKPDTQHAAARVRLGVRKDGLA